MRTKHATAHAALAALVLAGAAGAARAEGFYAGGSVGGQDWNSSVNGVRGDSRGVSGKLFGGYELSPHFAVEAGAMHLGRMRDAVGAQASGAGVYLDGVGRYELAPQWSVLGRFGVTHARFSTSRGDDSGNGLKVGAGLQYDQNSKVALLGEYEYYQFSNAFDSRVRVGQFTAGIKVAF